MTKNIPIGTRVQNFQPLCLRTSSPVTSLVPLVRTSSSSYGCDPDAPTLLWSSESPPFPPVSFLASFAVSLPIIELAQLTQRLVVFEVADLTQWNSLTNPRCCQSPSRHCLCFRNPYFTHLHTICFELERSEVTVSPQIACACHFPATIHLHNITKAFIARPFRALRGLVAPCRVCAPFSLDRGKIHVSGRKSIFQSIYPCRPFIPRSS